MEKVYVVGHLNPDTDTIVAALSLANLLNQKENTNKYIPVITGKPNPETMFVFERFALGFPDILENAQDKKLFLVDHNEATQIVPGWSEENIIGFVDHHKINFKSSSPIYVVCRPWGSSNSIIYDMYKKEGIALPDKLKPAMLAAILSDTVILKSPTTTPIDMNIVEELSCELNINFQELGMEMFKAKSKVANKTPEEIIKNDFKDYDMNGKKVGIGQIETTDLRELEPKLNEIIAKMKEMDYHTVVLMLTDIIKEGSKLLVVSKEQEKIGQIFNTKIQDNISEFLPGIMSRKKQVAKKLSEEL